MHLVFATHNHGKLKELLSLCAGLSGLTIQSLSDLGITEEIPETGTTFAENARIKARAAHRLTGYWALADDSGLEVDALQGAPGVYSARYAQLAGACPEGGGVAKVEKSDLRNIEVLLANLQGIPEGPAESKRSARFRCCLCLVVGDGAANETLVHGTLEGTLRREPQGQGGFGYDPLFVPLQREYLAAGFASEEIAELVSGQRTLAELSMAQKNRLSHRGRALRQVVPLLEERLFSRS